jgi:2-polyprenyl-3-methyl-5-hydroxy-6-metoxy-1,4-benzoquinol methylase
VFKRHRTAFRPKNEESKSEIQCSVIVVKKAEDLCEGIHDAVYRSEVPVGASGDVMEEPQHTHIREMVDQIRGTIQNRQQKLGYADPNGGLSDGPVRLDLASLQNNYDIYNIHFTSHRRRVGWLVVQAKRLLRKLLTPILERQLAYNAANTHLWRQIAEALQHETAASQALQKMLAEEIEGLYEAVRRIVVEPIEMLGQQQAAAVQALRDAMTEQVEALGQQQAGAVGALQSALANNLAHRVKELRDSVAQTLQSQQEQFNRTERGLADACTRITELERIALKLKTNLNIQERRLTMFLEEARKRLPHPLDEAQLGVMAEEERHALDALYAALEDQFRGSREEIKERLRIYLPILKEAKLGSKKMPILDVGCGRGEWLELLKEQNLKAQGVDVNRVFAENCKEQGLDVIERDLIIHLRSLPNDSLGAVTGFHIIEHLPFEVVVKFIDEIVRVLKPGGVAILETPNPENVLVGSHTFYLDPTHRNPLPSALVKFIVEARGLCRVEVMNLHSPDVHRVKEAGFDEMTKRFNDLFYGPLDYAVLGWKA